MKKILKNTIALAALLTLSTITLPVYAQTNLPEGGAEEVLVAQRISRRRNRFGRTRCVTVRRTRRWLYQRCRRYRCFSIGRQGRLRCRLVSSWRRRIRRRNRRFSVLRNTSYIRKIFRLEKYLAHLEEFGEEIDK